MRPDRILIGEVRGAESFDMLQAMNTGHEGSLTTIHANSPRDAIIRIENMVMMAGFDLPVRAIREQIVAALQIIIQLTRFSDGRRRITQVSEILGREGDAIKTQDLYMFRQQGMDDKGRVRGNLEPTGNAPSFVEKFALSGIELDFGVPATAEAPA
jgi:pilus assembly protein CpaF